MRLATLAAWLSFVNNPQCKFRLWGHDEQFVPGRAVKPAPVC